MARNSLAKIDIDEEQRGACVEICKYFHVSSANLSEKYLKKRDFLISLINHTIFEFKDFIQNLVVRLTSRRHLIYN